ncbi:MAG: zinc ribbon domain-containing protein [Gemmatimonadota bacterium]
MDELDRLYRRLVQNIRSGFPDLESRTFEVSQIYQQIVPYRTQRRELGIDTNEQYELALLQLLSGSRGYVVGDPEMSQALTRELETPNPDLSAYRAFGTSAVALSADALRLNPLTPVFVAASVPSPLPMDVLSIAARPTEGLDDEAPQLAPGSVLEKARSYGREAQATAEPAAGPQLSPTPVVESMPIARPLPLKVSAGEKCRYCSAGLPEGRAVVFCPGCGHNLTVQHCPACSSEMEVGWKFCITCGRDTRQ